MSTNGENGVATKPVDHFFVHPTPGYAGPIDSYAKSLPLAVIQKLAQAQDAMGPLLKDSTNPHLKNKYASLEAVLDTVTEPLKQAGLMVYQDAYSRYEGSQLVVVVRSYITDRETGEYLLAELPLPVAKNDAQAVGSAITYGRRYLLTTQCSLVPEDDDGNQASQAPKNKSQDKPAGDAATSQQVAKLTELAVAMYGDHAKGKLKEIVYSASKKRTDNPINLTSIEIDVLITGLGRRLKEAQGAQGADQDDGDDAPDADEQALIESWKIPIHAQEWAVAEGLVTDAKAAKELWRKVVAENFGGNLKSEQLKKAFAIYIEMAVD